MHGVYSEATLQQVYINLVKNRAILVNCAILIINGSLVLVGQYGIYLSQRLYQHEQ